MITEDYVSFETAKLLKEKGFDEPCFRYAESKEIYESGDWYVGNVTGGCIGVPTLQMAMKWLREVHNIFICISFRFSRNADNDINFSYYTEKYENHYGYGDGEFLSYEEACEAAIKYCLENLIDKSKDTESEAFAIVTNTKTGKWFRAKRCATILARRVDITWSITPNDIKDTIPVIGTFRLTDCLSKEELVGDNKKLHIEIFNADKVKQDEYFLYNVWMSGIDSETNEIVLSCDWVE